MMGNVRDDAASDAGHEGQIARRNKLVKTGVSTVMA
jgi:hypothetical protein